MRILIFAGYFYPHKGGYENHIHELASRLIKSRNEICVVCSNTNYSEKFENYQHIKIYRFPALNLMKVFPFVYHSKQILKDLEKEEFDVIITNTRFFPTSRIGGKFAKKNKIPLIHIEHGSTFVQTNNPIIWFGSRIYDYTFGKWIFNNADKIVSISEASKNFVKKFTNKDIEVIYNGISFNNLPYHKPKTEIRNLIYVGRLIYAKGVQDLILAFSNLEDKNLKLIIVGNGPYKKTLENLTKELNLQNQVTFTGEKDKEEVMKLLSDSDLFINPSYSEGLPTSILEAGTIGLPVIATDVGGTREVIENKKTGLLVQEKNIEQLRQAIEFIIKNRKEREVYGKNLNILIKTKFNWEEIIKKWERVIKEFSR